MKFLFFSIYNFSVKSIFVMKFNFTQFFIISLFKFILFAFKIDIFRQINIFSQTDLHFFLLFSSTWVKEKYLIMIEVFDLTLLEIVDLDMLVFTSNLLEDCRTYSKVIVI